MIKNWKSFCRWLSVYLFLILFFALGYWLMYYENTSSFYISEQYNERVNNMYLQHDSARIYKIPDRNKIPFTIDDFNQKLKSLSDSLLWLYHLHIPALKAEYVLMEDSLARCSKRFALSRDKEIDQYKTEALKSLQDSIAIEEKRIGMLEAEKKVDAQMLSSMYIELAALKMELAKRTLKVTTMIVENYRFFGHRQLGDTILFLHQGLIEKSREIWENEQEIHRLYERYNLMNCSFHRNRQEKVGFWDFLHFSTLIATSNSYGDILPNNALTRGVVTIQLLLMGVFWLGVILGWIESRCVK